MKLLPSPPQPLSRRRARGANGYCRTTKMMIFKLWFAVAALYLALTTRLSLLVSWLERRLPVRGEERG